MRNQARPYLLCYDIADPRRLTRVHRRVVESGIQLQYSVYYLFENHSRAMGILHDIERLIEPVEDDVRLYPLPGKIEALVLGRQSITEGVILPGIGLPGGFFGGLSRPK